MYSREFSCGNDAIKLLMSFFIVAFLVGCGTATLSLVNANLDKNETNARKEIDHIRVDPELEESTRSERLYKALSLAAGWSLELTQELIENDGIPVNYSEGSAVDQRVSPPLLVAVKNRNLSIAQYLLEQGANPHLPLGDYPLTRAVLNKDSQMVKLLLEAGANPNVHFPYSTDAKSILKAALDEADNQSATLIQSAGGVVEPSNEQKHAHFSLAKTHTSEQLNTGTEILSTNVSENQQTLLKKSIEPKPLTLSQINANYLRAIRSGNDSTLSSLLEKFKPEGPLWDLKLEAVKANQPRTLQVLIDFEPSVNGPLAHRQLLYEATQQQDSVLTIETLLASGSNTEQLDSSGNSLIMLSLPQLSAPLLDQLIERGISWSDPNIFGDTPLHRASALGFNYAIERFLQLGADPKAVNGKGNTPLDFAISYGKSSAISRLLPYYLNDHSSKKTLEALLVRSVDKNYVSQATLLLAAGLSPDARNYEGKSLLYLAVENKSTDDMVKLLLAAGADPNLPRLKGRGETPIMAAAPRRLSHVKLLMVAGGKLNQADDYGENAMDHLIEYSAYYCSQLKALRRLGGYSLKNPRFFEQVDSDCFYDDSNYALAATQDALRTQVKSLEQRSLAAEKRLKQTLDIGTALRKQNQSLERAKQQLANASRTPSGGTATAVVKVKNSNISKEALGLPKKQSEANSTSDRAKRVDKCGSSSTSCNLKDTQKTKRDGLALTWQNEHGKWFACGPVQCTAASNNSESAALDYVTNDDSHSLYDTGQKLGRCKIYKVSNIEVYDSPADEVKSKSKC